MVANNTNEIEFNEIDVLNMSHDAIEKLGAYYLVVVKGVKTWAEYNDQLITINNQILNDWYINAINLAEQHDDINYLFGGFMYCLLNPDYEANLHLPPKAERIASEPVFHYCWNEKRKFDNYFVESNFTPV
jgi:hypothetical protein